MSSDEYMAGQELGEKLLESIGQMNAGLGTVVYSPILFGALPANIHSFPKRGQVFVRRSLGQGR
jgi:hypothetical protein